MKRLIFSLMAAVAFSTALAGPALRRVVKVQQPDGTEVEAILSGDENGVVYTDITTGEVIMRTMADVPLQTPIRRIGSTPLQGEPHYPVILIEFPDLAFSNLCMNGDAAHHYDTVEELFNDFFNGDNYAFMGCNGSIRRYFNDQSYGQYKPQFDIIGKVCLSQGFAHYGDNHPATAQGIREALTLAHSSGMMSAEQIKSWDNNGDGEVDAVYAIFAGYNETYCGKTEYIWSHNSSFSKLSLESDETVPGFKTYVCSSELFGAPGSALEADGIGSAVHEFSHVLGLPDFYDVNHAKGANAVFGMDYFSLMDQGMYNNNAKCPTSYTAFERMSLGWLSLEELPLADNDSITVALPLLSSGKAFIYRNPSNPNEAFIFENHSKADWDAFYCGSSTSYSRGMLITHVDYVANLWSSNRVNTDCNHPHCTPLPADGALLAFNYQACNATDISNPTHEAWYADYRVSIVGDLWPGSEACKYAYRNKFQYGGPFTSLSKATTPQALFYDGTEAAFVIENIAEHYKESIPSDDITFSLKPFGYVSPTVAIDALEATQRHENGIRMVEGRILIENNGNRYDLTGQKR